MYHFGRYMTLSSSQSRPSRPYKLSEEIRGVEGGIGGNSLVGRKNLEVLPTLIAKFDLRKSEITVWCLVLGHYTWNIDKWGIMQSWCHANLVRQAYLPHFPEEEREVTWFAWHYPSAGWLSWDSGAGFLVLRADWSTGEEAQSGFSWNVSSDLDWTHFYEE